MKIIEQGIKPAKQQLMIFEKTKKEVKQDVSLLLNYSQLNILESIYLKTC